MSGGPHIRALLIICLNLHVVSSGYQAIIAFFFIICLPLNIVLNTVAVSATMEVMRLKGSISSPSLNPDASLTSPSAGESGTAKEAEVSTSKAAEMGSVPSSLSSNLSSVGEDSGGLPAQEPEHQQKKQGGWKEQVAASLGFGRGKEAGAALQDAPSRSGATSEAGTLSASVAAADEGGGNGSPNSPSSSQPPRAGIIASIRGAFSDVLSAIPGVVGMLQRVW